MNTKELTIGFVGNPNCGKTTLFNAYTGANLKVANWPGVTVEKKEGAMRLHDETYRLVDLPGTYSLTSYTMEEMVTRQYILSDDVDVIVDVADASALERNLYLTLQLIELGKPVVLALNMMDIVQERGMEIDLHRLPEMLGIPCVPVSARKKTGLEILIHTVAHHQDKAQGEKIIHHHDLEKSQHEGVEEHHKRYAMVYSDEIEDKIDEIGERLLKKYPEETNENLRWYAIKILENDQEIKERFSLDFSDILDKDYEKEIINQKFGFIEEVIAECVANRTKKVESTDRTDRILTHPVLGLPIFLLIMACVFFLTFTVGDWLKGYFEVALEWVTETTTQGLFAMGVGEMLISLITDGILAGVGGILTFLPNIFILFLALAFLEDSGYMARVAYVMDGIMGRIGLSGRAFLPMLLGFGCTVPAVMASRVLENRRDRMKTILITPFMSCSARLPIYVLFSELFFGDKAMIAAFSMYVLGLVLAILAAFVLRILDKSEEGDMLLIELPEYKTPNAHTIRIYVWEKVKDYLSKAGTTIFVASIVMWLIMNLGLHGFTTDMNQSFGAIIGKVLVPVFAPIGLGYWQIVLALISGIAAKEVVVSSCSVLFGIGNVTTQAGMANLSELLEQMGFGPLNAYALMVFCLLYVPCMAAVATIKKETESWRLTGIMAVFQLVIAWVMAFLIFQIGSLMR
ncbi:MAG: ferrous iron transport protein B [Lachnospiraceae bacterium]|nr:ferrous iron transport protein B [Lachnospiraceae bacterium]